MTVLLPNRELREDLMQETLALAAIRPEQLMWSGRPASKNSKMTMWDEQVEEKLAERLAPVREELKGYEVSLFSDMKKMQESARAVDPEPGWNFMRRFLAEGPRSAFIDATHNYLTHAGNAKLSAYLYISTEGRT